jgi:hypothetical protein
MTSAIVPPPFTQLLHAVCARAQAAGAFQSARIEGSRLICEAKDSAAPAFYSLSFFDGRAWVMLQTADRWLSQSIEQDLVHTGDKLDELIEEEMIELGYRGARLAFEHFRSPDKLFTFRTALPVSIAEMEGHNAAELASHALLGYEACFRRLGDMEGGDDE